jgi:hypothetical protein
MNIVKMPTFDNPRVSCALVNMFCINDIASPIVGPSSAPKFNYITSIINQWFEFLQKNAIDCHAFFDYKVLGLEPFERNLVWLHFCFFKKLNVIN